MSYDLHLLRASESGDIEAAVERYLSREEDEVVFERDPIKEGWTARLSETLRRADPMLEPFDFDYAAIARDLGTSEQDARARWRSSGWRAPKLGGAGHVDG